MGSRLEALLAQIGEAQIELNRSHHFLQTVIDAIPDSVMVIDLNHRIVLANQQAKEGDPKHYWADTLEANRSGWRPTISLDQGIQEYVNWFRKHGGP